MTVEIIGRACAAPGAASPEELFTLLRNRACTVSTVPRDRWDIARYWHPEIGIPGKYYTFAAGVLEGIYDFDPGLFGMSRREAAFMDPQQRILLELTWRALEDANIPASSLHGENVAVYVGASNIDHANLAAEDPAGPGPHFMTGNTLSVISNRISHVLGLNGPSLTVDTACSSSLVALDHAVKSINSGLVDTAIVAGVNVLVHPLPFVGFAQARMLSIDGLCKAYSNDGIGYVRAEGAAVLVLRSSARAAREGDRSHATIMASGINAAGRTNGISLPSREAQAVLLRAVYDGNGLDPERLAFVEGHGTGTKVGDPAEVWSLGTVIGQRRKEPVLVGSIKSNIGHSEPASGLLGVMKAMMALEQDYLPASLHCDELNDAIDFEGLNVRVAREGVTLERGVIPRLAGINSFGFGGANAHIVIADPAAPAEVAEVPDEPLFLASAHTAESLKRLVADYHARLAEETDPRRQAALLSAAAANRAPLRHRFVAKGTPQAIASAMAERLETGKTGGEVGESHSRQGKLAYVYSGNGSQWAGMGVDAYRQNSLFRESFDRVSQLFRRHSASDLTVALHDEALEGKLGDTRLAQPLLFAIQVALTDALNAGGLTPTAVYGHSVGEVAAAYASGALSLEDAVSVIAKRSLHQAVLAGEGTMAALKLGDKAARELLEALGLESLVVAAVNAPNSVTISGAREDIVALKEAARKRKIPAQVLEIDYPFHHPLIDKAKAAFFADAPQIAPRKSTLSFISTVTGGVLEGERLDAEYWWRNVRQPVQFNGATEAALALGCSVFLEISPRAILGGYVADTAQQLSSPVNVVATLSRDAPAEGIDPVAQSLARAIANGASADEARIFGARQAALKLPGLPFEKTPIHPDPTTDRADLYGRYSDGAYHLHGWRVDPNAPHWKNHLDARLFPDLAEHVVDGRAILPGSGFLEIALAAGRVHFGSDALEISNVEILRPLELSDSRMVELSTLISPETGDMQIRSRERLSDDDWTLHAVARLRKLTASEEAEEPDFDLSAPESEVDAAAAYRTARSFGLDYGPRFRLLERAVLHGERLVEVFLHEAASPGHPLVSFHLNPMSVDAVFHGLVALFGRLSGESGGAPYIPVRFGRVVSRRLGQPVQRAVIEIERISPTSIKANFHLYDGEGRLVASLGESRFRRTFLKQHKSLETLAFHYEAVPVTGMGGAEVELLASDNLATRLFASANAEADNATLLIQAATFSAIYGIARLLQTNDRISLNDLPQGEKLRPFLVNCLHLLADGGFATFDDGVWTLDADAPLPPAGELLQELYRDHGARTVELVMINDVYRGICDMLTSGAADPSVQASGPLSDATIEHFAVHSPLARTRIDVLAAALDARLAEMAEDQPLHVLELGSISVHVSRKLAGQICRRGGILTIFEPEGGARRNLELAFENDPGVRVIGEAGLDGLSGLCLVVSGSEGLRELIEGEQAARLRGTLLAKVPALLAVQTQPNVFADFVFGLSDGWFLPGGLQQFPLGRIADATSWIKLLEGLGFSAEAETLETAGGGLIGLAAQRHQPVAAQAAEAVSVSGPVLVLHDGVLEPGAVAAAIRALGGTGLSALALSGDEQIDQDALQAALANTAPELAGIVFLSAEPGMEGDPSLVLQNRVLSLSTLCLGWNEAPQGAGGKPLKLVMVAPGGAPVIGTASGAFASPVNAGLWAFARVLRNEFDFLDMVAVDTGPSKNAPEIMLDHGLRLLARGHGAREILADSLSGAWRELRAVPGPLPQARRMTAAYEAATIRQQVPSQVTSIHWESAAVPVPGPRDVVVKTAATGLNFRDVMWAMGLLPEEALEDGFAGASIGMEFSGEVVATGSQVDDLRPGDKVMAIAAHAFSTHVKVDRAGVARLPAGVDPVSAASIPVVFLTAYYAMHELGRIRAGETILIHGAAGGVGLAALQVAKHFGATVIATAGTREKRAFLETLGADHVFDSRSLGFVEDVRRVTGGEGVDLVLNSLFGEAMEKSLSLVKPFGRFLELGKRDYYADSKIGLRPFRRNISYFGIDADQLLVFQQDLSRRLLGEIGRLFEEGVFTPLPFRAFEHDEIGDAFRLMQNAGHIGKIVVLPPVAGHDSVVARVASGRKVDPDGMHLVVGGIGGFGLATADLLVQQGARHVALSTRRGVADEDTKAAVARWAELGVTAHIHACDVTKVAEVEALLARLRGIAPLKTVIHAAMVLDDAFLSNLNRERNRPVIDVKAAGATLLDRLTRQDRLDNFILFSSVTTLVGSPGQGNYVAANGFLEGLARSRRAQGLPALAVGFGAIADAGYLARNMEVNERLGRRIGKTALGAYEALSGVEAYLSMQPVEADAAVVTISDFDWATAQSLRVIREDLFEVVMRRVGQISSGTEGGDIDLLAMVEGKAPAQAQEALFAILAASIAETLRVPKETVLLDSVLKEIGLDSLMAVELGMSFEQMTGFEIPLSSLGDSATVGDVTRRLYEKVSARSRSGEDEPDAPAEARIMDELSRRHTSQAG
ncbi:SDR family NAD(P)-dependent oxidoreductase [Allorhizobium undicola]|uniref:SDR family NAD(P)-dependent oxidoreductase n=1 Tax=Allorhizobium undicola TaxID=78527 RepID=UPI003D3420DF